MIEQPSIQSFIHSFFRRLIDLWVDTLNITLTPFLTRGHNQQRVSRICTMTTNKLLTVTVLPILDPHGQPWEVTEETLSKGQPRTIVDLLDRHKALIFRSSTMSVEIFGRFVVDCRLDEYPYVGGAAPRRVIPVHAAPGKDVVFTANESPPDQPIPFHHELAQTPNPPAYIFFYCDVPPLEGGETPIIDSTAVYRYTAEHHPDFLTKLVTEGARYTRTLPDADDPSSPIGRSYQNTWQVQTRDELDAKLATKPGVEWFWLDDGSVRITTEAVPAIRLVEISHEKYNYVYQYVFANSIVAAYLGWQDVRNDRMQALTFGNGDKMPTDVLESIAAFMQQNRVVVPWQKGDMYVPYIIVVVFCIHLTYMTNENSLLPFIPHLFVLTLLPIVWL